jgi:hypothetical protein
LTMPSIETAPQLSADYLDRFGGVARLFGR